MRASSARLLHTAVRLADITFPTTGLLLARTRLAFVHLDNLITFAKRDRDGRVDGFLAGYLPDELVLLFFRQGEVVNAASLRPEGRGIVPVGEALRRLKEEPERGEVAYAAAPPEQLAAMYAACAGPARPLAIDPRQPAELFRALAADRFSGTLEFISHGRVSYLRASGGRFTGGWFCDRPAGMPVAAYMESLFALLPDGSPPVIAASVVPDLGPVPTQALPPQVVMYRDLMLRLEDAVEAELPGEGALRGGRARAGLREAHPVLELLALGEDQAIAGVAVPAPVLTAALAAWTTRLLEGLELVVPGSAPRILREITREQRFALQAAGYYERLPWRVNW